MRSRRLLEGSKSVLCICGDFGAREGQRMAEIGKSRWGTLGVSGKYVFSGVLHGTVPVQRYATRSWPLRKEQAGAPLVDTKPSLD
jgi:hypothetical protein